MSIRLFISTHGTQTPSHIYIAWDMTVSDLKDEIKAKRSSDLADIGADKLVRLWKVEIPHHGNSLIQDQTLQDDNQFRQPIILMNYWTDTPPKRHIHVIKLPARASSPAPTPVELLRCQSVKPGRYITN